MVPEKIKLSCIMMPICFRRDFRVTPEMSVPSIRILPESTL